MRCWMDWNLLPRIELPIAETLGAVSAEVPLPCPFPKSDFAVTDGWAFCAQDLVGASSYSPLPLAGPPVWVEAGDPMPSGSDCVVDSDLVELLGPMFQVSGEALPGQGVRRAGSDIGEGGLTIGAGRRLGALDLMLARATGLKKTCDSPSAPASDQCSGDGRVHGNGPTYRRKRSRGWSRCRLFSGRAGAMRRPSRRRLMASDAI